LGFLSSISIEKVVEGEVAGCDTDWNLVKQKIGWSEGNLPVKKKEE